MEVPTAMELRFIGFGGFPFGLLSFPECYCSVRRKPLENMESRWLMLLFSIITGLLGEVAYL